MNLQVTDSMLEELKSDAASQSSFSSEDADADVNAPLRTEKRSNYSFTETFGEVEVRPEVRWFNMNEVFEGNESYSKAVDDGMFSATWMKKEQGARQEMASYIQL